MRIHTLLPLAAGLALAACGGNEAEEADAGEGMSMEDAMEATDNILTMTPGEYRTSVEVLEFNVPGVPEAAANQMRSMFTESATQGMSYCLTAEEAEEGPRRMVQELAESDCAFSTFDVSGGDISTEMSCVGADGLEGTWRMDGSYDRESSDLTTSITQTIPGVTGDGTVEMRLRMQSERVGECS